MQNRMLFYIVFVWLFQQAAAVPPLKGPQVEVTSEGVMGAAEINPNSQNGQMSDADSENGLMRRKGIEVDSKGEVSVESRQLSDEAAKFAETNFRGKVISRHGSSFASSADEDDEREESSSSSGEGKGKDKDSESSYDDDDSSSYDEYWASSSSSSGGKSSGKGGSSSDKDGDKQKWEHVGNGACRTKDGGRGTYDKIAKKDMSADDCREACAESTKCQGYETSKNGSCELHEKKMKKVDSNKDFNCYNKKGKDKDNDKSKDSDKSKDNDKSKDSDNSKDSGDRGKACYDDSDCSAPETCYDLKDHGGKVHRGICSDKCPKNGKCQDNDSEDKSKGKDSRSSASSSSDESSSPSSRKDKSKRKDSRSSASSSSDESSS